MASYVKPTDNTMLRFFALGLILSSTSVFGQFPGVPAKVTTPDQTVAGNTAINVVYKGKVAHKQSPALFLNGIFVSHSASAMANLRPDRIGSINVVKGALSLEGMEYDGKLYVQTKSNYVPRISSLTALKKKYVGSASKSAIFMIDDEFIQRQYDTYTIDENDVSSIIVDAVDNPETAGTMTVIKLVTKKPGGIRIRGGELGMNVPK